MTTIKKRISAFIAAFVMMGAVSAPALSDYVTSKSALTAYADEYLPAYSANTNFRVDVKANTKFRESASPKAKVVASTKHTTKDKPVYIVKIMYYNFPKSSPYSYLNGTWLYSKYDKGWVNSKDVIY